jgi:hypothetical protein
VTHSGVTNFKIIALQTQAPGLVRAEGDCVDSVTCLSSQSRVYAHAADKDYQIMLGNINNTYTSDTTAATTTKKKKIHDKNKQQMQCTYNVAL